MSRERITPGYKWYEIPQEHTFSGRSYRDASEPRDLQAAYPLPDRETLQQTWDNRSQKTIETDSGTKIHTMTFNEGAEGGTIFWLPGWGVTNRWNGGARVVTAMAALNPNKVVRTADELQHVPRDQKMKAMTGDIGPYANNYMYAIDDRLDDLNTLSGHSRGGLIQTHLAAHADMPDVATINIMDPPRARSYATAFGFVMRVGVLDNIHRESSVPSSRDEEDRLIQAIPEIAMDINPQVMAYNKARRQWWLLQAMAKEGLRSTVELMIDAQPDTEIFWWHGTKNVGAPARSMRKLIHEVRADLSSKQQDSFHYFEAPAGHFSEGHTGRYGRQTSYAIDHSKITNK
jgi:hypothetical protein